MEDTNNMLYLGLFLPPIKREVSLTRKALMVDNLN